MRENINKILGFLKNSKVKVKGSSVKNKVNP